jgi:hypothetical protein
VADWAQALDKEILANAKWKYIQIGATNKAQWKYQISRIRFAFYRLLNKKISTSLFAERAHARCYKVLLKAAIKLKADWYIGHNPGAMAIAANAAKKTNAKAGFDFEDYYKGEFLDSNSIEVKRQVFIENKYIKEFNYLSAASPLIKEIIQNDFPSLNIPFITLLNTFSLKEQPVFVKAKVEDNTLNLFWFSQHVGKNRGLQIICEALKEINDINIHLTLAGNCTNELKNYFTGMMVGLERNIHFAGLIPPMSLAKFSAQFDVGLALEPGFSQNNNVALSNKIFTYLLAGNAIILSETAMQKKFNNDYHVGKSFPIDNINDLKDCIQFYKNKSRLTIQRENNYLLASNKLNWENEAAILLEYLKRTG